MKISTKGRYGLRAMLDIVIYSLGDHVPLNSIAERQDISEKYLQHLFASLKKAGLVKSIKGAQGGYALADSPDKITVGQVLRALEGDLNVSDENPEELKIPLEVCLKESLWEKLNKSINEIVDGITLEDIASDYQKMNNNFSYMFYI